MSILKDIITENNEGKHSGIYSCCSANPDVIRAAMKRAISTATPVLVESTSNQVNQNGGYTGMQAADFAAFVKDLAKEMGIPWDLVILGGDHLGPLPWVDKQEAEAMDNAEELVVSCVMAGYTKIHLDTSMRVASDDPNETFATAICAARGARLCAACEKAFVEYSSQHPEATAPVYVIGSEVPVPGGDFNAGQMDVSAAEDATATIAIYKEEFEKAGCAQAWDRVVGLVLEMGVEFHAFGIDEYNSAKAADLVAAMRKEDLCIEGHSTDFQTHKKLELMCKDGVGILKVGPSFTFSLREAMFALELIEKEIYHDNPEVLSNYREVLDSVMVENPKHWKSYYQGSENEMRIARSYSFYDRCRYYLTDSRIVEARDKLIKNLSGDIIPLCMLSQYLPDQYKSVRRGTIKNEPLDIILDHIGDRIDGYLKATNWHGLGDPANRK